MGHRRDYRRRFAVGLVTALLIFCNVTAWAHAAGHQADTSAAQDCPTCFSIQISQHSVLSAASAIPALEHAIGGIDACTLAIIQAEPTAPNVRGPPSLPF